MDEFNYLLISVCHIRVGDDKIDNCRPALKEASKKMVAAYKRFYILTQRPVELGRPFVFSLKQTNAHYDALFCDYAKHVESRRQEGGADLPYYLTKREIERWGELPPCGPRMEVIPISIHTDELK